MTRRVRLFLLLACLLAVGCGEGEDGGKTVAPDATPTPQEGDSPPPAGASGLLGADKMPWPAVVSPEVWELAGWLPRDARVEGRLVDPQFLRDRGNTLHTRQIWFESVDAWQRWMGDAKLPDEGYVDVVIASEPERFYAYKSRLPESKLMARLLENGYKAESTADLPMFIAPWDEEPSAAFIDGRLVLTYPNRALLVRIAAVRAGREPSAQGMAGVEDVAKGVGAGLPVELAASTSGLDKSLPGAPPTFASVGRLAWDGTDLSEVRAVALGSAADVDRLHTHLVAMLEDLPLADEARPTSSWRGAVMRIRTPAAMERFGRSYDGGIHNDIRAISRALERYRAERGALPSSETGLSDLAALPGGLNEFLGVLPKDPWGHPYAYQAQHPQRPDSFLVRSMGPDGELDTEDDVLLDE